VGDGQGKDCGHFIRGLKRGDTVVAKTDMDMSLSKASEGGFIENRCGSKDVTVGEFLLR
jgi:hypothetical protein